MRTFPLTQDFDFAGDPEDFPNGKHPVVFCLDLGVHVVRFVEDGPGGNPCVTLRFDSIEQLRTFCDAYADGDEDLAAEELDGALSD